MGWLENRITIFPLELVLPVMRTLDRTGVAEYVKNIAPPSLYAELLIIFTNTRAAIVGEIIYGLRFLDTLGRPGPLSQPGCHMPKLL